jgi:hypothetical protein
MLTATLLCSLRSLGDLAYMLPGCMPVGMILMITAVLPLAAALAWIIYHWRRVRVSIGGELKLKGTVEGVPRGELVYGERQGSWVARRFLLRCRNGETLPVAPDGALVPSRRTRIRGGQKVTVLALRAMLPRGRETLFRESSIEPGVQAVMIARDRLQLLRCSVCAAVTGWLALAGWMGYWQARWPQQPADRQEPVRAASYVSTHVSASSVEETKPQKLPIKVIKQHHFPRHTLGIIARPRPGRATER